MNDIQYITSQHPAFIESMYQDFIRNPDSVDPEFKKFFEGFERNDYSPFHICRTKIYWY